MTEYGRTPTGDKLSISNDKIKKYLTIHIVETGLNGITFYGEGEGDIGGIYFSNSSEYFDTYAEVIIEFSTEGIKVYNNSIQISEDGYYTTFENEYIEDMLNETKSIGIN